MKTNKSFNDAADFQYKTHTTRECNACSYGYDDYMVDILDFEFISVDCIYFEEKENQVRQLQLLHEGFRIQGAQELCIRKNPSQDGGRLGLRRQVHHRHEHCVFDYGPMKNVPKNVHDISRARMSYSVVATNLRRMVPKSYGRELHWLCRYAAAYAPQDSAGCCEGKA